MFKFFRKYEKWLLVVGGSVLMVVFLIDPFMHMFMPNPAAEPIGRIDGKAVSASDQYQAGRELEMIGAMFGMRPANDPLQWLLMKYEARLMGISASDADGLALLGAQGNPETEVAAIARRLNVSRDAVQAALRDLAAMQRYIQVIAGGQHLSLPLLERFAGDMYARVRIAAVVVPAARYFEEIEPPTEADLLALFEQHKADLRGESEPYGFGYKFADRLKIEFLEISADALAPRVSVSEADALAFYQANRQEFEEPGEEGQPPRVAPYEEVRSFVLGRLRRQARDAMARQMLKAAQVMLATHERELPRDGEGYRDLAAEQAKDWRPMSFEALADQLQERFGVRPMYRQVSRWLTRPDIASELPELGPSWVLDVEPMLYFVDYAFSARELEPQVDEQVRALRLQAGIVGEPLVSPLGSYFLMRITEAQAEHEPASLDEVRSAVDRDARRLAAYELLLQYQDQWQERARQESFQDLAIELRTDVITPPAFARRRQDLRSGFDDPIRVTDVPGIGADETFLRRLFSFAEQLPDPENPQDLPQAQRITAIPVDSAQALALVRIEGYELPMRRQVESLTQLEAMRLGAWLMGDTEIPNPFEIEAIKKRVGFVETPRSDQPQPPAEAPQPRPRIIPQS